jgi:hypothetical protein
MPPHDCVVCRVCLLVEVGSFVLLIAHFFPLPDGKKPRLHVPIVSLGASGRIVCVFWQLKGRKIERLKFRLRNGPDRPLILIL